MIIGDDRDDARNRTRREQNAALGCAVAVALLVAIVLIGYL